MAENLIHLGNKTDIPAAPHLAILETVPNAQYFAPGKMVARFTCPEFTSLCPHTGQPDFATIVIDYVPNDRLVESKALKLFLGSFRNHGAFHEACTQLIAYRINTACKPAWLRVAAFWYPRGGIPIDVFVTLGDLPAGIYVPALDGREYRGR